MTHQRAINMPDRAVLITTFHRIENIPLIISCLLESKLTDKIIITNHNPQIDFPQDNVFKHPKVKTFSSEKPLRASAR